MFSSSINGAEFRNLIKSQLNMSRQIGVSLSHSMLLSLCDVQVALSPESEKWGAALMFWTASVHVSLVENHVGVCDISDDLLEFCYKICSALFLLSKNIIKTFYLFSGNVIDRAQLWRSASFCCKTKAETLQRQRSNSHSFCWVKKLSVKGSFRKHWSRVEGRWLWTSLMCGW